MGASFMFTIGTEYSKCYTDTTKANKHIPLFHYFDFEDWKSHSPKNCSLVGVEICYSSEDLTHFTHPERASYLLGNEAFGIPSEYINKLDTVISIPSSICLNVSVAGSIVMYDRVQKLRIKNNKSKGTYYVI